MIVRKIRRKLAKLCCAPIEVFVFHAVSDCFDERENNRMDWFNGEPGSISLKSRAFLQQTMAGSCINWPENISVRRP